jgi:hypothetical protein
MTMIGGVRDPIIDRGAVRVIDVPGSHACLFSHPDEVAERVNFDERCSTLHPPNGLPRV